MLRFGGPSNETLSMFTLPLLIIPPLLFLMAIFHFILTIPSARFVARFANGFKWGCWFGAVGALFGLGVSYGLPMAVLYAIVAAFCWLIQRWMRWRMHHLEKEAAKLAAPTGD